MGFGLGIGLRPLNLDESTIDLLGIYLFFNIIQVSWIMACLSFIIFINQSWHRIRKHMDPGRCGVENMTPYQHFYSGLPFSSRAILG